MPNCLDFLIDDSSNSISNSISSVRKKLKRTSINFYRFNLSPNWIDDVGLKFFFEKLSLLISSFCFIHLDIHIILQDMKTFLSLRLHSYLCDEKWKSKIDDLKYDIEYYLKHGPSIDRPINKLFFFRWMK